MTNTGKPASPDFELQAMPEHELHVLFEEMGIPFSYNRMIYDADGRAVDYTFLAVNRAFERETGRLRGEIIGKTALEIFPQTEQYWIECFGRVGKTGKAEHITEYSAALNKWYSLRAYSPQPEHVAVTVSDVTRYVQERETLKNTTEELRTQQEENRRLAHEEPITGLPNRVCLYNAFTEKTKSGTDARFSVAIFAPDNLAEILASYGSALSDTIMRIVAQRVCALLPEPNECFSMTGTDLVLLFSRPCDERPMREVLECVHKAIRQVVEVDGASYYITASCGVACYPRDSTDRDELITKANLALYQAKRAHEPMIFFSDQISQTVLRRTQIRNALPKALENHEFELYFQPQIHPVSERLLGFEALLRWHSPTLGEVSPLECISVAEESRLIHVLGEWVLRNACQTLYQINKQYCTDFFMAVNVSGLQLQSEPFVERVFTLLTETNVRPDQLEIEVTESVLLEREYRVTDKLNAMYARGVRVALDDFGTGFSSLSMLKDLKISTLKIDRIFIQNSSMLGLAKMMVRLGHLFGAKTVAEGVENEEQMRFARHTGCDRVQGYFHALPMPLDSLKRYLETKACR